MRHLLIIVAFLISLLSGERKCEVAVSSSYDTVDVANQSSSEEDVEMDAVAISPLQSARYCGDETYSAPSVRTTAGRRIQFSQKFPFLFIKSGRIFGRNEFLSFITKYTEYLSEVHSASRYIHTICILLV